MIVEQGLTYLLAGGLLITILVRMYLDIKSSTPEKRRTTIQIYGAVMGGAVLLYVLLVATGAGDWMFYKLGGHVDTIGSTWPPTIK